jgi:hypothetical protein
MARGVPHVERVLEFMRWNAHKPLTAADVAQRLGITEAECLRALRVADNRLAIQHSNRLAAERARCARRLEQVVRDLAGRSKTEQPNRAARRAREGKRWRS